MDVIKSKNMVNQRTPVPFSTEFFKKKKLLIKNWITGIHFKQVIQKCLTFTLPNLLLKIKTKQESMGKKKEKKKHKNSITRRHNYKRAQLNTFPLAILAFLYVLNDSFGASNHLRSKYLPGFNCSYLLF